MCEETNIKQLGDLVEVGNPGEAFEYIKKKGLFNQKFEVTTCKKGGEEKLVYSFKNNLIMISNYLKNNPLQEQTGLAKFLDPFFWKIRVVDKSENYFMLVPTNIQDQSTLIDQARDPRTGSVDKSKFQ